MANQAASAPPAYGEFDKLYVGGRWRAGGTGEHGDDTDPWSGELIGRIALANTDDVKEAFASARDV